MSSKTDEWRSLAGDFDMPACCALSEACDLIDQLEAQLKAATLGWDGAIESCENWKAKAEQLEARLALAEKVCQSAEWVIQDPTLTHTDCSSEPWEQSHDSRDRLADDVKAWRAVKEADGNGQERLGLNKS